MLEKSEGKDRRQDSAIERDLKEGRVVIDIYAMFLYLQQREVEEERTDAERIRGARRFLLQAAPREARVEPTRVDNEMWAFILGYDISQLWA